MTIEKSTRGGARPGAGRPQKIDKKKKYSFKLSDEELQAVRSLLATMRNKLVIVLVVLLFGLSASAQTLQGGISYTETEARNLAFDRIVLNIDMGQFSAYKFDHAYFTHKADFKGGIVSYSDRVVCPFYAFNRILLGYAIKYDKDRMHTYYYDRNGVLERVDIHEHPHGTYPSRVWRYNSQGKLEGAVWAADSENGFVFDKNGKLMTKWVGNIQYDNKGKVMPMSRRLPY